MARTQTLMALVIVGGTVAAMAVGSQPASSDARIGVVKMADAGIDMIVTGPVPSVKVHAGSQSSCDAGCQQSRLAMWRKRMIK